MTNACNLNPILKVSFISIEHALFRISNSTSTWCCRKIKEGVSITKHYCNPAKKISHRHNYPAYILNKKAVAESMPNHIKNGKNNKDTVLSPFLNVAKILTLSHIISNSYVKIHQIWLPSKGMQNFVSFCSILFLFCRLTQESLICPPVT